MTVAAAVIIDEVVAGQTVRVAKLGRSAAVTSGGALIANETGTIVEVVSVAGLIVEEGEADSCGVG